MYPTGYSQRPGNFSTVYPVKSNFDGAFNINNSMPSVHSVVHGPGYGATPPYKYSGEPFPTFENNLQGKRVNPHHFYDSRNGFAKTPNGYRQHVGSVCWSAAPTGNHNNQRVCYGECKRSGRMCASCMEYAQSNYGYQKMAQRGMSQVVSPPYPQRHPSWHGGIATDAPKHAASMPTHNGYPLQRSNSTPSGYGNASAGTLYPGSQEMGNHQYWGPKSQPIDINRAWCQNNSSNTVNNVVFINNNVQNRVDSCSLGHQQSRVPAMQSPSGVAIPQRNHNAMVPHQQAHMNSGQWNSQVGGASMPNTCIMGGNSPVLQTNLDNRPGSLPGRVCTFPPTPPAEPQYAPITITSTKSMNTGSCQLAQVPTPVLCSPTPSPRGAAPPYWNGPSPITKQSTGSSDAYQYCTNGDNAVPTSDVLSQPGNGPIRAQTSNSVSGAQPACASVPPSCDLANRDWQNDIADITATDSCEVREKARVFSAELEKLARMSTTFDEEPAGLTSSSSSDVLVVSTTVTSVQSNIANGVATASPTTVSDGKLGSEPMTPTDPPQVQQNTPVPQLIKPERTTVLPVSDSTPSVSESDSQINKDENQISSNEPNEVEVSDSEDAKSKTTHSDYLNQTSDVNPYGSQNCIAALSASCRKMIADLDKPEREPEQHPSPRAIGDPHQQQMCLNGFTDTQNSLAQCYNPSYNSNVIQQHSQSFPLDPYMHHYPQLIHPRPPNLPSAVEKPYKGRKRKSTCSRAGHADQPSLVKQPKNNSISHLPHCGSPIMVPGAVPGNPGPIGSSQTLTGCVTDLDNISPTFTDGPVNLEMLDSVFSPDVALDACSNDLSSLLDGTNSALCDTFADYDADIAASGLSDVATTRCPPSSMTPPPISESPKERHPLEILQDQIKMQRQQFSLEKNANNIQKLSQGDSPSDKQPLSSDINDNHVIDSRS